LIYDKNHSVPDPVGFRLGRIRIRTSVLDVDQYRYLHVGSCPIYYRLFGVFEIEKINVKKF
jgi:hypothetical protein